MASPNSTFTEIVTTTLREHPDVVADNVSDHNALYRRLKSRGKIKKLDGGYEIVRPLDYEENSTFQRYSGYDPLNISESEVLSAAKYAWVQSAINVTASGLELRQNSGKNQIIDLAAARVRNAMRTASNNMSVDLYSSGSLSNQMGGLGHIISTNGEGTVGGIVSATYTWWKNQFQETDGTPDKTVVPLEMKYLWLQCSRGTDKPDLIVSTHDFFSFLWQSMSDLQRYASADEATAGFQALKFVTADVVFDSNTNFTTTGEKMFFLNTNYLELCVHKDANWSQLDEKSSVNQDAVVIPIIWQGQLTCSNRSLQGVLFD
jgi:hypothetical protein